MLFACIAVETHPIGGITFFYIFSYILSYEREFLWFKNVKGFLLAAAGLLAGALMYYALHHQEIGNTASVMLGKSQDLQDKNFLAAHFWGRNSYAYRYFPELILFATSFIAHFAYYRKKDFFFPLTVVMLVISTFVFRRGNPHYALFIYPAFLLLTVHTTAAINAKYQPLRWLVIGWLLLMLPQYLLSGMAQCAW